MLADLNFNDLSTGGVMSLITVLFAVLGFVKGLVRVVFSLIGIGAAGIAAYWAHQNSHKLISNFVEQPEPWMSTVLTIGIALGVLSICRNIFGFLARSLDYSGTMQRIGFGAPAGIMGLIVGAILTYGAISGVRYFGSVAELRQLDHELKQQQLPKSKRESLSQPLIASLKQMIEKSKPGQLLQKYDIFNQSDREEVAKILIVNQHQGLRNVPIQGRGSDTLLSTVDDPDLVSLIKKKDYASILTHPSLRKTAEQPGVQDLLQKLNLEKYLGPGF